MTKTEKFEMLGNATNYEVYDPAYGWMHNAVETHDEIDDFIKASESYNECSREKCTTLAGFNFVAFECVQIKKGMQRHALSVIDFGDFRVAVNVDLTDYV